MEDQPVNRPVLIVIALAVVIGGTLLSSLFLGGQTSHILSTVGSAIGPPTGDDGAADGDPEPGPTAASTVDGGEIADAGAVVPTLLIVRTGEIRLEVADLAAATAAGDEGVIAGGGYVSGSTRTGTGAKAVAEVTYRIPSARWDATVAKLRGLARLVDGETITSEEVSGEVVDLRARIANLRVSEAALQAIMAKAVEIDAVLDVQKQLTTTRGEIEQLVGKEAQLQDQAAFGSLKVTYHLPAVPAPAATPVPVKGWDPGADAARATDRLVRIGQAGTSAGIWLAIVGLPLLVVGSVLALVGWQVIRLGRWIVRRRDRTLDALT